MLYWNVKLCLASWATLAGMILLHIIPFYHPLLLFLVQRAPPVFIVIQMFELIGAYLSFKTEGYGNAAAGMIGSLGSGMVASYFLFLLIFLNISYF